MSPTIKAPVNFVFLLNSMMRGASRFLVSSALEICSSAISWNCKEMKWNDGLSNDPLTPGESFGSYRLYWWDECQPRVWTHNHLHTHSLRKISTRRSINSMHSICHVFLLNTNICVIESNTGMFMFENFILRTCQILWNWLCCFYINLYYVKDGFYQILLTFFTTIIDCCLSFPLSPWWKFAFFSVYRMTSNILSGSWNS